MWQRMPGRLWGTAGWPLAWVFGRMALLNLPCKCQLDLLDIQRTFHIFQYSRYDCNTINVSRMGVSTTHNWSIAINQTNHALPTSPFSFHQHLLRNRLTVNCVAQPSSSCINTRRNFNCVQSEPFSLIVQTLLKFIASRSRIYTVESRCEVHVEHNSYSKCRIQNCRQ